MPKKCRACGSHVVRRSRFQGSAEHTLHPFQSPYRCAACGNRFFVVSRKTKQAAVGLVVGSCVAFPIASLLFTPDAITSISKLRFSATSPKVANSNAESKGATLAEIANEWGCTDRPINVHSDTYKCRTKSGLPTYFVVPEAKPRDARFDAETLH